MTTKHEDERRQHMVGVKFTEAEYETLRIRAFEARKSVAGYVRDLALAAAKRKEKAR